MNNEETLMETFQKVGNDFGFDKVQADFAAFKELKCRWQRTYKWADFKISDYLEDAPQDVIEGLARSLYSRICGVEGCEENYSEAMVNWLTTEDFVNKKQPIYLRRCRNSKRTTEGAFKNLNDSYDRLVQMGLAEKDDKISLSWATIPYRKAGTCSVLMKTILISDLLDVEDLPDFVLDYVLFRELGHTIVGFDPTGKRHQENYDKLMNKYFRKEDAEKELAKLFITS